MPIYFICQTKKYIYLETKWAIIEAFGNCQLDMKIKMKRPLQALWATDNCYW